MVEQIKDDEVKTAEKGKVIIKKEAFRNMLTHVLRYGSEALTSSVEVMGVCMGKNAPNKDDLIVTHAVPITHGSSVEVGFSPEDYAAFAAIDEEYSNKGLYAVGWYHSHPGWGCFFSDTDIKNHLFYQKEQTPHAFGIVFDHTLMGKDGNLGFEVYRLDDYNKGPAANYIKVPFEVEMPSTLDYFKWVKKFMEDSQKKDPILIKELNEMTSEQPAQKDLQEIPIPAGVLPDEDNLEHHPQLVPVISGFQEGMKKLNELFGKTFKSQVGEWSKDVDAGASKGSRLLKNTLVEMNEAINFGMGKVKSWFEMNVEDIVEEFKTDVTEYLNQRLNAQKELADGLPKTKEEIISSTSSTIEEKIKTIVETLEEKSKEIETSLEMASQDNETIENLVNASSESIGKVGKSISDFNQDLIKEIEASLAPLESNVTQEVVKLNSEFKDIRESYANVKELIEKLQKVVMDIRNL